MVSLASLAGERLFFVGDSSSGVSGDLESATAIAIMMEGYWGMGSTIACHGVTQKVGIGGGGRPGEKGKGQESQDLLHGDLGGRIETKLEELLARTELLVGENRRQILAVAHALETHKTVTGDDVIAVIEARQGPLIDGRVYANPTFLATAEAYHQRALEAHVAHSPVDLPLPVLAGVGLAEGPVPADGNGLNRR
jgi:hypothetical protein